MKKTVALLMALLMAAVAVGCTPATEDVYSNFYEMLYRDPETGEFVDPDEYAEKILSQQSSSDGAVSAVSSEAPDDFNYDAPQDNSSAAPQEEETVRKAVTVRVKDYGAVGDGKTDDGKAVTDALIAFMKGGKGSKMIFEKKTYYIRNNGGQYPRALTFSNMVDSSVEGNGATILVGGALGCMTVSDCTNFKITGLNFDRKIRANFVGTITAMNTEENYCDVVSDRDFEYYEDYVPGKSIFAFAEKVRGEGSREYIYMSKLSCLDKKKLVYRFYPNMDGALASGSHFLAMKVGQRIIIPTPYVGHVLTESYSIGGCSELYMKDINAWNNSEFVFHVNGNTGKITFDNVNIVPAPDETSCFSSWRDGFHCKTNSGPIIWKNCKAVGLGDDIINISTNLMYVCNKHADDEISCFWEEAHGGAYGGVKPGQKVTIVDTTTGKLIAKTAIKRVVDQENNRYQLANKIPNLKTGKNIIFSVDSHGAPGSQLINCDFEGTLRFKGAGGTATNCKLKLYAMVLEPAFAVEGPIPYDITFNGCDFAGTSSGRLEISCCSPISLWKEGYYRLENIKFVNNRNLTRGMFGNDLNFNPKSVDYITVSPAPVE